ncbi:unnamed protein product [Prorocentrum cordatum]|uniref:Uncharacterized protein n=1 Tax=Prorocentrum cordatum TaxID=2364126 RepID=A0ABN9XLT0_9DINO|nr:unnamed protein product [Polarella glacialis]
MDTAVRSLQAQVATINNGLANLSNQVTSPFEAIQKQVEVRIATVEGTVNQHTPEINSLKMQISRLQTLLGDIQSERPTPKPIDQSFNREIDPSILAIRSRNVIPKQNMLNALKPWLERNNLAESDFVIEGDPASKKFSVRIGGSRSYAERKVAQCMSSLKRTDGQCERFAALDVDGQHSELFISGDKNSCMALGVDINNLRLTLDRVFANETVATEWCL